MPAILTTLAIVSESLHHQHAASLLVYQFHAGYILLIEV
jgi:hypothetical protein